MKRNPWPWLTLLAIVLFTGLAPLEKTLGANIRLVYLHGAWVWVGIGVFGLAALAGLAGLLGWKPARRASESLGWTGLLLWLTYLPVSMAVMRINWGGFYFDEPRWRIPMTFAVVGVLLQAGLWLLHNRLLTAAGNLGFGAALWWSMFHMQSVLHPDSPVFQSNSLRIQVFFGGLLLLMGALALQIAAYLFSKTRQN